MKDKLCAKERCTGCLACVYACPKDAISITKDFMGFSYPQIDKNRCVSCNRCTKQCHILTPALKTSCQDAAYRYQGGESIQMQSSSGGFIPLLIQDCLKLGFYISGVVFSEDFLSAAYVVTRSADLILKMRKSKYVEADVSNVFHKIEKLLIDGEKVLFVGLPCHVAALKSFTGNNANLLTVDLICHGNGSPHYYCESLKSFCKSQNQDVDKIQNVDFRPKPELPGHHEFKVDFEDASIQVPAEKFPYYYGFNARFVFRDCCYQCEYSKFERVGDITAGDSTFTDSLLGESIVMANTDNGVRFLERLKRHGGFRALNGGETEMLKKRFADKDTPKHRKKIKKIKQYDKLEKTYLSSAFVPVKYKIKRLFIKMIRRK